MRKITKKAQKFIVNTTMSDKMESYRKFHVFQRSDGEIGRKTFSLNIPITWVKDFIQPHLVQKDVKYHDDEGSRQILTFDESKLNELKSELIEAMNTKKFRKLSSDDKQAWMNVLLCVTLSAENLIWFHSIAED